MSKTNMWKICMNEQIDKRSRTDSRSELQYSHPCVLINLIIVATCVVKHKQWRISKGHKSRPGRCRSPPCVRQKLSRQLSWHRSTAASYHQCKWVIIVIMMMIGVIVVLLIMIMVIVILMIVMVITMIMLVVMIVKIS